MNTKINEILQEIESVIVGKNEIVEKILMAILAQGHVLMEDVPGVGKTTTAMAFAKVLGLDTRRVQFTSDTVPSDIIGFSVYDKKEDEFVYKPGAIMTNLLLADEINRTSSKTQSALLEAMEEHKVTVDGKTKRYRRVWLAPTMNGRFYGGGMMVTPDQHRGNAEGKVSVCVMHGSGKIKTLAVFPSIFKGGHVKHTEMVEILTGHDIEVRFDSPCALQIDGETIRNVTSYSVHAGVPARV